MSKCYRELKKVKEKTVKKSLDEIAGDLAYARLAMIDLASVPPGSDEYQQSVARLFAGFAALDNAGVFREIDEHTGYEPSEDVMERVKATNSPRKDPAEWGDLSGYTATSPDLRSASASGPLNPIKPVAGDDSVSGVRWGQFPR